MLKKTNNINVDKQNGKANGGSGGGGGAGVREIFFFMCFGSPKEKYVQ